MRIGAVLSPVGSWSHVLEAARLADDIGLDAIGLWGHYHSARPEWAYVSGWSAYGALAAVTRRVRLVPMVLNNLHYQPGVLAKESSLLAIASAGRFELAIGGGDWPESFAAWGERFPTADERLGRLVETIRSVRRAWAGGEVSMSGRYVSLAGACIAPVPVALPRVVVGVGASRATAHSTVDHADELNVYADEGLLDDVQRLCTESARAVDVSLFLSWEWDKWPSDPLRELDAWRSRGVDRVFVSLGGDDMPRRLEQLARIQAE